MAIHFQYNRSQSLAHIDGFKSDSFLVLEVCLEAEEIMSLGCVGKTSVSPQKS